MYCSRFINVCIKDRVKLSPGVKICRRLLSEEHMQPEGEQVRRVIKKIPPRISKLIYGQKSSNEWPTPKVLAELTLRCSAAGVSVREMEAFLIKDSRNKSKTTSTSKEDCFYSKHIFDKWKKGQEKREIERLLEYHENRLLRQKDKVELPIKRIEYIISLWRVIFIIEDCIKEKKCELQLVTEFGDRCFQEYENLDVLLYTSLAELQLTKDPLVRDIGKEPLVDLLRRVARRSQTISSSYPRSLQFENLESALLNLLKIDINDLQKASILFSLCLFRWRTSNFSESLQALSMGTSSFLQFINQLDPETLDEKIGEVSVQFCSAWMEVCGFAIKETMTPALDYLEVEKQQFMKNIPIIGFLPSYLCDIAAAICPTTSEIQKKSLFSSIPVHLKDERFERLFAVEGITEETKLFFTVNFLKKCLSEKTAAQQDLEADQEDLSVVTRSDCSLDLKRELLDVKILERLVEKDGTGVLDLYLQNAKFGLYPGTDTLEGMVQFFTSNNDTESLNLLYRGTSEESSLKGLFYTEISNIETKKILNKWEAGDRLVAWIGIVELYRNILSDRVEARIERGTAESLVHRCRQICKLFIEESIHQKDSFEDALRSGGLRLASEYRDVYILLSIWEAWFFSPKFEAQQKAEKIMEDYPQLVRYVKIDQVLNKAEQFDKEDLFRRLLELNLRHESTPYNKSRTFEALLRYQTKSGNVKAGEETIKTAKALDIRITADFLQDFIQLREENNAKQGNGIVVKISTSLRDLFKLK